jgi:hypothetical protein
MSDRTWLLYVLMAGLCWGTYVPLIAFGGKNLGSRYAAFLCVGVAYFVIAVVFPLVRVWMGTDTVPAKPVGLIFAGLAGVAGALGALGVIFATAAAKQEDRIYIAPLIFTLAPLLNTVVSLFWHPDARSGDWFRFGLPEQMPSWKLFVGVVLVGVGAGLILLSKEEMEVPGTPAPHKAPASPTSPPPVPEIPNPS